MTDERTQHLELVAATLTQAYYTAHRDNRPDHRDLLETYFFLLEGLVDHDSQGPGEVPIKSGDSFAPDVPE